MRNDQRAATQVAQRLLMGSERLADLFRQENTLWLERGIWLSPLLDGMVEPFLRRVGIELLRPAPDPSAPFAKAGGLLRLSLIRGEPALLREIQNLQALLEDVLSPAEATPTPHASAPFMIEAIETLRKGCLDELDRLAGRPPHRGAPRFGGLIIQIYEDPRYMARWHAQGRLPTDPVHAEEPSGAL